MGISVLRCIILYIFVVISVRVMGKRQVGELQPSEFVITIMISELAALPLQDLNMPLLWGITPMFVVVALELLMSFFTMKSMRFRAFCYGRPVLLIYQGKIDQKALLSSRVSMEDIMESMRDKGLLRVEDIQIAVLETNGVVSIIPKPYAAPPSAKDLKMKLKEAGGIPEIVVMEGSLIRKNMKKKCVEETDINDILSGYQIDIKDVFMLTIDDEKKTFLVRREGI